MEATLLDDADEWKQKKCMLFTTNRQCRLRKVYHYLLWPTRRIRYHGLSLFVRTRKIILYNSSTGLSVKRSSSDTKHVPLRIGLKSTCVRRSLLDRTDHYLISRFLSDAVAQELTLLLVAIIRRCSSDHCSFCRRKFCAQRSDLGLGTSQL